MPRALNLRGLRKYSDVVNLPREINAAVKASTGVMKKADQLVRAGNAAQVEQIIGEAWHETVADLAFTKDPYVAFRSLALATITAGTDLVLADFDFMKEQSAVANTTAEVENNLLDDKKVFKPCLIHNLGIDLFFKGAPADIGNLFLASINISRDKDTIFEVPLMACVKSLVVCDPADTAGSIPHVAVGEQAAAGLEIEGHGIPMAQKDSITVEVHFPAVTFANHATIAGKIAMHMLMDGEVMGE